MGKEIIKLQNILLPMGEPYTSLYKMYDRGEEKEIKADGILCMEKGQIFDGSTYFNSCSAGKWFEYTNVKELQLKIKAKGDFTLKLTRYTVKDTTPIEENAEFSLETQEEILISRDYSLAAAREVVLSYPNPNPNSNSNAESQEGLLSFMIVAHGPCEFLEGCYEGIIDKSQIRPVTLTMAITTFQKEEFILRNLKLLRKEILESGEEIADHFYVHVVDNGRTLDENAGGHSRIQIHGNINAGGSGGFARGMIETMKQPVKATHILLMDDDVLIQTESIKRTYVLLKILKPKYCKHFLSGAMLFYENMHVQHEDVGYVIEEENGGYGPVKPAMDLYKIEDCCYNEMVKPNKKNQYAGWWYCCIPMEYVREDNLPLPLFVRGDDVEYSLRNKAEFLTMNGICVWHMGFTQKFNAAMEFYQVHRNSLMYQAISQVCPECNFLNRMEYFVRTEIMRFRYDGAELLLEAVEDFCKGPEFLRKAMGAEIIKEKSKKNEKLRPLAEFPNISVDVKNLYKDVPCTKSTMALHRLTYNGHYLPKKMLRDETGVIPYDWFLAIGKQYRHTRLLAVNPHTMEANLRIMDKKRGRKLRKRAQKVFRECRKREKELQMQYNSAAKEFTSLEFWEKYLGI